MPTAEIKGINPMPATRSANGNGFAQHLQNGADHMLDGPSHDSLFKLGERTVALTGGLGGIGAALTQTLLLSGADVAVTDMQPTADDDIWHSALETAKRQGARLSYTSCDVTSEDAVAKAFTKIESDARYPLRGLVTLAGISGRSPAVDYPAAAFRKIMDVNVMGTFLCAQAAARIMQRQNVRAQYGGVDTCAYNTSKSAVLQMARNLAAEWGNDGKHAPIRVNTISPGYINTPMTMPTFNSVPGLKDLWEGGNMLGRLSDMSEHQSSVIYLLSDGSSYVTAADLKSDGGHCAW